MPLRKDQIEKAREWQEKHQIYILSLIRNDGEGIYAPDDWEDKNNPALWKGAHWRWFIKDQNIEL